MFTTIIPGVFAGIDDDGDGLTDAEEALYGTNPTLPDSDFDGLFDGWVDTSGDQVWDAGETPGEVGDPDNAGAGGYHTEPMLPDTDFDGLSDGVEVEYWNSRPDANWNDDYDQDGVPNLFDQDSDDDGYLFDGTEVKVVFRTNAIDVETVNQNGVYIPGSGPDGRLDYVSGTWIAIDEGGLSLDTYLYDDTQPIPPGVLMYNSDSFRIVCYTGDGYPILAPLSSSQSRYILKYEGNIQDINGYRAWKYVRSSPLNIIDSHILPLPSCIVNQQVIWFGTDPVNKDTDYDILDDIDEVRVLFRTNIRDGDYKSNDNTDKVELFRDVITPDYLISYAWFNWHSVPFDPNLVICHTMEGYPITPNPFVPGDDSAIVIFGETDDQLIPGVFYNVGLYWMENPTIETPLFRLPGYRYQEVHYYGTDPTNPDTDFDGLMDSVEVNAANAVGSNINEIWYNGINGAIALMEFPIGGEIQIASIKIPVNDYALEFISHASMKLNGGLSSPLLAPKVDYPTGERPIDVCSADIDGDTYEDVLVVNSDSDTISYFRNNGQGIFILEDEMQTGENPMSIYSTDLDNDGDIDVIVISYGSSSYLLSFFENNGDGTFKTRVDYSTGRNPHSIYAVDLNNDAYKDIIISGNRDDIFLVHINNRDRTFAPPYSYNTGDAPAGIFAEDFDFDGDYDVVVTNTGSDSFSYFENYGDGTFAFKVDYPVEDAPQGIIADDFDGDGDIDVVNTNGYSDTFSVSKNVGDGTFTSQISYTTGDSPVNIFGDDFDLDGDTDIVVTCNGNPDAFSYFENLVDGTFAPNINFPHSTDPRGIWSADFDGDKDSDVIVTSSWLDTFSYYQNIGTLSNPKMDVGNDGDVDWLFDGKVLDFDFVDDFSNELNVYITSHSDADDGFIDGYIDVPLIFYTNSPGGELEISELDIQIEIIITDPLDSDSDHDGLMDGKELNAAQYFDYTLDTISHNGVEDITTSLDFTLGGGNLVPKIKVPNNEFSSVFVSDGNMNFDGSRRLGELELINSESTGLINYFPAMASDSKGDIHIVWQDSSDYIGNGPDPDILYKKWDGNTWTVAEVISTESIAQSETPNIIIDSLDNPHIVWVDYTDINGNGHDADIFYKRWDGSMWTTTEVVSTESTDNSFSPDISIDSNDCLHLTWNDKTDYGDAGTDWDIFYKKWDGNSWSITEIISQESSLSYYPSITTDSNNIIHIVWQDCSGYAGSGSDYDIFYRNGDGSSWSTTLVISEESLDYSATPTITTDYINNIHVAWKDTSDYESCGSDYDIFYKYWDGVTWTKTEVISTESTGTSYQPSISSSIFGDIYIVWADETDISGSGSDYDIVYKKLVGDDWTSTEIISTEGSSQSHNPYITFDFMDNLNIVWYESSNPVYHILFKQYGNPYNILLDIGRDNDIQFDHNNQLLESSSVYSFSNEMNVYITSHEDIDDGLLDNFIEVPLLFSSDSLGKIQVSDIFIRINIIVTNPLNSDTDGDAIFDGKEMNSDKQVDHTIDTIWYESNEYSKLIIDFANPMDYKTAYIKIPENDLISSMEYASKASVDLQGLLGTGTDVKVNDDIGTTSSQTDPSIAEEDGFAYIVWTDDRDGDQDIYFNKYNILEETWEHNPDLEISNGPAGTNQVQPSIFVELGNIYVVWSDDRSGGYDDIYFNKYDAETSAWGTSDVMVNSVGRNSDKLAPKIVVRNQEIYVVWKDQGSMGILYNIYFAKSTDGGSGFDNDILVNDMGLVFDIDFDTDGDGNIYVVWFYQTAYEKQIHFDSSNDGGLTFGSDKCISDPNIGYFSPSLTLDNYGNILVTFITITGSREIHFIKSIDNGESFQPVVRIDDEFTQWLTYSSMIVDKHNTIHVAWEDYRNDPGGLPDETDIYYANSIDFGESFSNNVRIDYGSANSVSQDIATDFNNLVCAVWQDTRNSDNDIYLSRLPFVYNPTLDVGNNGDIDWKFDGGFTASTDVIDFSNAINEYIVTHGDADDPGGIDNYIWVPLTFYSEYKGAIQIDDLDIRIETHVTSPINTDSDDDEMPDGWELFNGLNSISQDWSIDPDGDDLINLEEYEYNTWPLNKDSEDDGLPDGWEVKYSLEPFIDDSGNDEEPDGLTNFQEYQYNTNPNIGDTDGDSLSDFDEINLHGTDPTNPDSDNDGLTDSDEILIHLTLANDPDSDDDDIPDGWEILYHLDPWDPADANYDYSDGAFNIITADEQTINAIGYQWPSIEIIGASINNDETDIFTLQYSKLDKYDYTIHTYEETVDITEWISSPNHGEVDYEFSDHIHTPSGDDFSKQAYMFHYIVEPLDSDMIWYYPYGNIDLNFKIYKDGTFDSDRSCDITSDPNSNYYTVTKSKSQGQTFWWGWPGSTLTQVGLHLKNDPGYDDLTVEIWSIDAGQPLDLKGSGTFTKERATNDWSWHLVDLNIVLTNSGYYYIILKSDIPNDKLGYMVSFNPDDTLSFGGYRSRYYNLDSIILPDNENIKIFKILADGEPIDIFSYFNTDGFSFNEDTTNGDVDGIGNSYPAEEFPTLLSDRKGDGYDFNGDDVIDSDEQFTNLEEYQAGTSPILWDSDGDGINDGWEVYYGLTPVSIDKYYSDAYLDLDDDGATNIAEFQSHSIPIEWDNDKDGLINEDPIDGINNDNDYWADDPAGNPNEYDKGVDELFLDTGLISDQYDDGDEVLFEGATNGVDTVIGTPLLENIDEDWSEQDTDGDGEDDFTEIIVYPITDPNDPNSNSFSCSAISASDNLNNHSPDSSPALNSESLIKAIIVFNDQVDLQLIELYGGTVEHTFTSYPAAAVSISLNSIQKLTSESKINYIEYDRYFTFAETYDGSTDSTCQQEVPWNIEKILPTQVSRSLTGKNVKIAILDAGIDYSHPDLKIAGGVNFVSLDDGDYGDNNGHGTHVAGIIGAQNNDFGLIGIAPDAEIYSVKVLNDDGIGLASDIAKGLDWAIQNGMDIISMSFGSDLDVKILHELCNKAYREGIILLAASGSDGDGAADWDVDYPARYNSVIAVGAVDKGNNHPLWSSEGPFVEVAAPGVAIKSTWLNNNYKEMSGTSMATPHVTGLIALMLEYNPDQTPDDIRSKLQSTAKDYGEYGKDDLYGFGIIDFNAIYATIDGNDNYFKVRNVTGGIDDPTVEFRTLGTSVWNYNTYLTTYNGQQKIICYYSSDPITPDTDPIHMIGFGLEIIVNPDTDPTTITDFHITLGDGSQTNNGVDAAWVEYESISYNTVAADIMRAGHPRFIAIADYDGAVDTSQGFYLNKIIMEEYPWYLLPLYLKTEGGYRYFKDGNDPEPDEFPDDDLDIPNEFRKYWTRVGGEDSGSQWFYNLHGKDASNNYVTNGPGGNFIVNGIAWTNDANKDGTIEPLDIDEDGLDDSIEYILGTYVPMTRDQTPPAGEEEVDLLGFLTAPDGIWDYWQDSDKDGLLDNEIFEYFTNPTLTDTDGDKLSDGYEVHTEYTEKFDSVNSLRYILDYGSCSALIQQEPAVEQPYGEITSAVAKFTIYHTDITSIQEIKIPAHGLKNDINIVILSTEYINSPSADYYEYEIDLLNYISSFALKEGALKNWELIVTDGVPDFEWGMITEFYIEISGKTDPLQKDTDTDGWIDGDEVNDHKSDPLRMDPLPYWGFTWHFKESWISDIPEGYIGFELNNRIGDSSDDWVDVESGNFDSDIMEDEIVVIGNSNGEKLKILDPDGSEINTFSFTGPVLDVEVGDFDVSDSRDEIFTMFDDLLCIRNVDGIHLWHQTFTDHSFVDAEIGNFDTTDPRDEFIVIENGPNHYLSIRDADGNVIWEQSYTSGTFIDVEVGNFDDTSPGDEFVVLVGSTVQIKKGNGDTLYIYDFLFPLWDDVEVGNFDDDPLDEIVLLKHSYGLQKASISVRDTNIQTILWQKTFGYYIALNTAFSEGISIGDLDGDNKDEIIAWQDNHPSEGCHGSYGIPYSHVYLFYSDGTLRWDRKYEDCYWNDVVVGQFVDNGKKSLSIIYDGQGYINIFYVLSNEIWDPNDWRAPPGDGTIGPPLSLQREYGVDWEFQKIWEEYLEPTHSRVIRFDIKVMEAVSLVNGVYKADPRVVTRWANLCLWAKENDAWLMPSIGKVYEWNDGDDYNYIIKAYTFVKEFAKTVCDKDPEAYQRILSYQVENEMNHPTHHKDWWLHQDDLVNLIANGARKIRQAEEEINLKSFYGVEYTPLTVNYHIDIGTRIPKFLMGNGWLFGAIGDIDSELDRMDQYMDDIIEEQNQNYGQQYLDIIGIDYYPDTWSFGDYKNVLETVERFSNDRSEKVLITESGYSDMDWLGLERYGQEDYYKDLTKDLEEYYWKDNGKNKGFLGIIWYELFDSREDDDTDIPWERIEYNFGVIETPQNIGSHGRYPSCDNDFKPSWKWLTQDLVPYSEPAP